MARHAHIVVRKAEYTYEARTVRHLMGLELEKNESVVSLVGCTDDDCTVEGELDTREPEGGMEYTT